jgi:hypothetical protein
MKAVTSGTAMPFLVVLGNPILREGKVADMMPDMQLISGFCDS